MEHRDTKTQSSLDCVYYEYTRENLLTLQRYDIGEGAVM